jgi:hypothetical protein
MHQRSKGKYPQPKTKKRRENAMSKMKEKEMKQGKKDAHDFIAVPVFAIPFPKVSNFSFFSKMSIPVYCFYADEAHASPKKRNAAMQKGKISWDRVCKRCECPRIRTWRSPTSKELLQK